MTDVTIGMKFILADERVGQCVEIRNEVPEYAKSSLGWGLRTYDDIYYKYDVRMLDNDEIVTYDSKYLLISKIVFLEKSGFEIGDYFEIKRTGLQPDLRGRLISIDENDDRWPYRIADESGNSASFSYFELTKIHSVISRQRAPKAIETLQVQLAIARAEVEALETALEVLQYASA